MKTSGRIITSLTSLIMVVLFSACGNSDMKAYEELKATELSSGKRVDSIFMGIYFGMTSKQFFAHCWRMNKQGIFTDGLNNTAVLYKLNHGELTHDASMNFYPDFDNGKIYRMKATFKYDAWAPWNKNMFSDSLLADVRRLYTSWYPSGNDFIPITNEKKGTIYVKIDGNRRITIGRFNDVEVRVHYTDLITEQNFSAR